MRVPILAALIAAPCLLQAQANIDSLHQVLATAPPDTTTVKRWIDLGKARIDQGELDNARADLQKAFDLSRRLQYANGEGRSTANIGITYFYQGRFPEALGHFERALAIADSIGDETMANNAKVPWPMCSSPSATTRKRWRSTSIC